MMHDASSQRVVHETKHLHCIPCRPIHPLPLIARATDFSQSKVCPSHPQTFPNIPLPATEPPCDALSIAPFLSFCINLDVLEHPLPSISTLPVPPSKRQHSPPNHDHPRRSLLPYTRQRTLHILERRHEHPLIWHRAALNDRDREIRWVSRAIPSSPVFGRHECADDLAEPRDAHEHEYGACAVVARERDRFSLASDAGTDDKGLGNATVCYWDPGACGGSERGREPWKDEWGEAVCTKVGKFLASASVHYRIALFQLDGTYIVR